MARTTTTASALGLSLAVLTAASLLAVGLSADAALIRDSFDLDEAEVGAIASCIYLGAASSSIVGGRLTDRRGPAPVLVSATALLATGGCLAALAPTAALFYVGVVVAGLGYGAVNPPTNVLADPGSVTRRGLVMSVKQSGIPLGGVLAGLLVPPVAVAYGWRLSLALPVAVCLVLAGVFAAARPTGAGLGPRPEPRVGTVRLRLPRAYAFGFLLGGVQVTIFTFLALYLVDERGDSAESAGSQLALLLVGGLVGRVAWGYASDRWHGDRPRVLQVISAVAAGSLLLVPVAGSVLGQLVHVLVGLSSVGWNGVFLASIAEAADPDLVGIVTGRAMVLVNLGAVLLPPAFGFVVAQSGRWSVAWWSCAALTFLSALLLQTSRAVPESAAARTGGRRMRVPGGEP